VSAGDALRVLLVGAEIYPFVKTGGLADVLGALPQALGAAGADARVLLPALPPLAAVLRDVQVIGPVQAPWGGAPAQLLLGHLDAPALRTVPVYLLRHDPLYQRPGTPYGDGSGRAFADNHRRFALLGLAAARGWGLAPGGTIVLVSALVFAVTSVAGGHRLPLPHGHH